MMTAAQRAVYTKGPDEQLRFAERVPDYNERAEMSVLGSMLIDGTACALAIKMLMPHHFYSERNKWLFDKLASMFIVNGKLDEVLVGERLVAAKVPGDKLVSIREYLGRVIMETPTAANVEQYCELVLSAYERREVSRATLLLQKGIADGHDLRVLVPQFVEVTNAVLVERETKDVSAEVDQEIKDEIDGKRYSVDIPGFRCLSTIKMFLPGCVSAFVGAPNAGKSSVLLEWFWRWHLCGVSVACLMLESGAAFHLRRCLAQLAERTDLLDDKWCKRHPDEANALTAQWGEKKDAIAKAGVIQAMPRGATHMHITRWMDNEFRSGRRILAIDPITLMAGQEKRFLDQEKVLGEAQNLADKHRGSVLFSMHPKPLGRGERRRPSLDQLPGSQDFQKALDNVVWLTAHEPLDGDFPRLDEYGHPDKSLSGLTDARKYNRTVTVLKKRRAGGWMPIIGANMDGKTLWTTECGWL